MTAPPIPRMPHPDVAVVKSVLREIQPGDILPFDAVTKALGYDARTGPGYRRAATARNQLRREGISVVIAGDGFLYETPEQTLARHQGRERKGMCRKARKAGESLATINVVKLTPDQRAEFYAERTTNNVVYRVTDSRMHQRLLAAAKVSEAVLPMQKALEVLGNGH